jgi:protein gp37
MGNPSYKNGFAVTEHERTLNLPTKWIKKKVIFVNSMSDLFHKEVNSSFIDLVFETIKATPQHIYQILTKRPERLLEYSKSHTLPNNALFGVSVEDQDSLERVKILQHVECKHKFLSIEPLLGPLHITNLNQIDWVIVGGESGPHSREMNPAWVRYIRDICLKNNVPFFFKQWGGTNKKKAGRLLDEQLWDQFPDILK